MRLPHTSHARRCARGRATTPQPPPRCHGTSSPANVPKPPRLLPPLAGVAAAADATAAATAAAVAVLSSQAPPARWKPGGVSPVARRLPPRCQGSYRQVAAETWASAGAARGRGQPPHIPVVPPPLLPPRLSPPLPIRRRWGWDGRCRPWRRRRRGGAPSCRPIPWRWPPVWCPPPPPATLPPLPLTTPSPLRCAATPRPRQEGCKSSPSLSASPTPASQSTRPLRQRSYRRRHRGLPDSAPRVAQARHGCPEATSSVTTVAAGGRDRAPPRATPAAERKGLEAYPTPKSTSKALLAATPAGMGPTRPVAAASTGASFTPMPYSFSSSTVTTSRQPRMPVTLVEQPHTSGCHVHSRSRGKLMTANGGRAGATEGK